jgi:hypothetical protein
LVDRVLIVKKKLQKLNNFVPAIENSFGGNMFDDFLPSDGFQIDSLQSLGIDMFANDFDVVEDEALGIVLVLL